MPLIAGTSSVCGPSAGSAASAPSDSARSKAARASATRKAMDGAQGPCASAKRAAWLPGSSFSR